MLCKKKVYFARTVSSKYKYVVLLDIYVQPCSLLYYCLHSKGKRVAFKLTVVDPNANFIVLHEILLNPCLMFFFSTAVDCGPLDVPENGVAHGNSTTYPSVMSFSCKTGFSLQGTATRKCQADGRWTNGEVACLGIGSSLHRAGHVA